MKDECKEIIFSFIDLNDKNTFGDKKWGQEHEHRLRFLKVQFMLNLGLFGQKATRTYKVKIGCKNSGDFIGGLLRQSSFHANFFACNRLIEIGDKHIESNSER